MGLRDAKEFIEDNFMAIIDENDARNNRIVYIKGDWDLEDTTSVKSLPDNLTVNGSLNIANTAIEDLPKGLIVKGQLFIENTNIIVLPVDLIVKSTVYGSEDLKEYARRLMAKGSIRAYRVK